MNIRTAQKLNFDLNKLSFFQVKHIVLGSTEQIYTLYQMLELLPMAVIEFDLNGNCTYLNKRWSLLSGKSIQESLGSGWVQSIYSKDRELFFDNWNKLIKDNLLFELDFRLLGLEDTIHHLKIETIALQSYDGEVVKYLCVLENMTNQYLAYEKLATKTKKLNEFFELSTDIFCICDLNARFLILNTSFYKIFGFNENEVINRSFFDFIHPKDLLEFSQEIEKLKHGHSSFNFEFRVRSRDGKFKLMVWNASSDPSTNKIFLTIRDVSEIRKQEILIKQVMDALNRSAIVVISDKSGNVIEVNAKFEEMTGYSKSELLQNNHNIISSNIDPEENIAPIWETIQAGKVWSGEIRKKTKNGKYYVAQNVISPLFNIEGQIDRFLAIKFDITKTKESERLLENTERVGKVGSWKWDLLSDKFQFSKQFLKNFKVDKNSEEVTREYLRQLIHPDDQFEIQNLFNDFLINKKNQKFRFRIIVNSKTYWLSSTREALLNNLGQINAICGTCQDISELVEAEEKSFLEHSIALRNSRLATLGEMSAGIAHEINNPLMIIKGMLSSFKKTIQNDQKINSKLKSCETALKRIEDIANGLKKFSKLEESSDFQLNNLSTIIRDSFLFFNEILKNHQIKLILSLSTNASIQCSVLDMEQVLLNLINNSIYFINLDISKSEKWIRVNLFEEKNELILQVVDSGAGIPKELEQKLFQPFFTTKKIGEGAGLGLSIIQGILTNHNATIKVNNNFKNTCFEVKFSKFTNH